MTNKLAKTGHQSISHAELVSASSTQAVLPWKQQRQALKTLKQVQGDGAYFNNNAAFTLIELLVVVLIIGILASVALPQYNKAVRKARVAEIKTVLNAAEKSVDAYLLENGVGTGFITGQLDLDISSFGTLDNDGIILRSKSGDWQIWVDAGGSINLGTSSTSKLGGEVTVWIDKSTSRYHCGYHYTTDNGKEICEMIASGDPRWSISLGSA